MPTITSVSSGNWATAGVWDLSRKPASGDDVVIAAGHSVTVNETGYCLSLDVKGTIIQNSDLVMDDTAGALILIEDSGDWSNNGTSASPRQIRSASTTPTNPWYMTIEDVVGTDSRTLDLKYLEFIGNLWTLGNDADIIQFNGSAYTSPKISAIDPISRPQIIEEHEILGRNTGRVYATRGNAGTVLISGSASWDSWLSDRLEAMKNARLRVSLITRFVHLPRALIERAVCNRSNGLYYQFSVTLIEDE